MQRYYCLWTMWIYNWHTCSWLSAVNWITVLNLSSSESISTAASLTSSLANAGGLNSPLYTTRLWRWLLLPVLSCTTPSLSLDPQLSVSHHLSLISPPSSLIPQPSLWHRLSLSFSHESIITVSQSSITSQSLSPSCVPNACQPNQLTAFSFPERKFSEAWPFPFQDVWFKKWPLIQYNQVSDKTFTLHAWNDLSLLIFKFVLVREISFLTMRFCNWKDTSGDKRGGFASCEHTCAHIILFMIHLLSKIPRGVAEMISSSIER